MKSKIISHAWRFVAIVTLVASTAFCRAAAPAPAVAPELQVADQLYLAIPNAGLGKDYLFTASLIPQSGSPTSHGLTGRIVRFELFPDGVDMYESTQGLVVTADLPARRLLASFPIVRRETNRVVIDFNKGMRRVLTRSWVSVGGSSVNIAEHDNVLDVPGSRVHEMRQESGKLVIRQSVQVRDRESNQNTESLQEVRYFISPYKAGSFAGKEPSIVDGRYTRFFQTENHLEPETGRTTSSIARFDLKKPLVFYYSGNTPPEYVQPIQDAILYWNKAFGKQVVQAKKAPEGMTAPDAGHNIIQWVPWDNAGVAYADILPDPLTGESQHGQAYITTVFTFKGKARARALLRAMEENLEAKKDDKKGAANLGVPFLPSAACCEMDTREFAQQMARGIQDVLASEELTEEAVLRVSQDYLREVVAHEVGHVLGLRHNFAGSLNSTISAKELDEWFKAYMAGTSLDAYTNKLVTSSMMEYTAFKAACFVGWQMRISKEPLPHDRAAIGWGYFDSPEARTNKMLFGTDEHSNIYGDVKTFDYGTAPVIAAYTETAQAIDRLPGNVIEIFIGARAPKNPNDRVPLELVSLRPSSAVMELITHFTNALMWFNASTRSLRVESQFDYIGELNQRERALAHWKYLNSQIEKLGGVDRAVFSALPSEFRLDLKDEPAGQVSLTRLNATNLTAKLVKLLESTNYMTFTGLDDKKYSFTKEERALIAKRGALYFKELEKSVVKQVCKRLENAPRNIGSEANEEIGEDDIIAKLDQRIIEIARHVILARATESRIEGRVDKASVQVTDFKYDQETRLSAAKMLNERVGSFKGWADEARGEIRSALKKQVDESMNIDRLADFRVSLLSRPLRDWYQQQQEILALLPPTAPSAPSPSAGGSNAPAR